MTKVLLTGGTGFLGAYVARLLVKSHYEVYAIHRKNSKFDLVQEIYEQINWVECDLHDTIRLGELVADVDAIIHCAAMVSFQSSHMKQLYATNVFATAELVNLALVHDIKRFVHMSSIAALGRESPPKTIDENSIWADSPDNNYYGLTKHLGEREIWRGQAEGLNMIILNPSLIIGAGDFEKGSPAMAKRQHQGNPFYPLGSTGFVDVRDVARLTITALESDIQGERFIISGTNATYRTFLNLLATHLKVKKPALAISRLWRAILWRADYLKALLTRSERLISKENLKAASHLSTYDATKSLRLSSTPYYPLEKTITDISLSYIQAKEKGLSYAILSELY